MRKEIHFKVDDIQKFKVALLQWAQQFEEVVWLDSNEHTTKYTSFDALLAADASTSVTSDSTNAFGSLQTYQSKVNDWIFGYLSYDLKNDVEHLTSNNVDELDFPDLFFFQPKRIISISGTEVCFKYLNRVADEIEEDLQSILGWNAVSMDQEPYIAPIRIRMRIFKDEYFKQVHRMLAHIHRGDIYEANFCQEFYAENTEISPLQTYQRLNAISKPPFATYLRFRQQYVLSASPERYLRKSGDKVISQPIKGTARRSSLKDEDQRLKLTLQHDEKERAENIMIVDLVRNDLARSALKGSVTVEELCEVYSFEQVHQMISTVSAKVRANENPIKMIKQTFPMGSMTGAPKVSAMKIIEELESFRRGVYSGAVGYFTPNGDFDFNVIIRSILYNQSKRYVSFSVGSAITAKSIPENEYEECLLKAKAMRQVLEESRKV